MTHKKDHFVRFGTKIVRPERPFLLEPSHSRRKPNNHE
jgi:hypothetical protein